MFKAIRPPDGSGPLNLNPIRMLSCTQTKNVARVARGEIAPAGSLEDMVLCSVD
jgi:hypothetical protein